MNVNEDFLKTYAEMSEIYLDKMRKLKVKFVKISPSEFNFYLANKIFGNLVFKPNFLSLSVEALTSGEYQDMQTYLEKNFWQVIKDESGAVIDVFPDGDTWSPQIFEVVAAGILSGEMIAVDDIDRYWKVSFENDNATFYKQAE